MERGPQRVELDSLVYSYPRTNDAGFQTLISAKYEFNELSTTAQEEELPPGGFFRHQTMIHRFLAAYARVLLVHETGTGKTCAAGGEAENLRAAANAIGDVVESYFRNQPSHIKRVIVLVRGPLLRSEFRRELLCRCVGREFFEEFNRSYHPKRGQQQTVSSRRTAIWARLKRFYRFMTYTKFAGLVTRDFPTDDAIKREFSGTYFIVDEVHNMRPQAGTKRPKELTYDTIKRVFHLIERAKIVLMTGTPMVNRTNEIAYIMNLILPPNMQMDPNWDYDTIEQDRLLPYFQGRISYIREADTPVTPVPGRFGGNPWLLSESYTVRGETYSSEETVELSFMSTETTFADGTVFPGQQTYYKAIDRGGTSEVYKDARQAANFVFPDGTVGSEGFEKYVVTETIEGVGDRHSASPELQAWLENMDLLALLGSKFHKIVNLCVTHPGNCFIYTDFYVGSGAVVLGLAFGAQGFERFSGSTSAFLHGEESVCGLDRGPIQIATGRRYAILSKKSGEAFSNILELFNSRDNMNGEYLKVLITTPVGREGINTSNVLQVHIASPWFNRAVPHQARSRALRATSHRDLIEQALEKLRQPGLTPEQRTALGLRPSAMDKEPKDITREDIQIIVDIYQHAAVAEYKAGEQVFPVSEGEFESSVGLEEGDITVTSIDLKLHSVADEKQIRIDRMMRIIKALAFDCLLHFQRNTRPGPGRCTHRSCDYTCHDPPPDSIDYSSYDVLYSGPEIDRAAGVIREIMHENSSLTLDALYALIGPNSEMDFRERFIDMAVEKLIREKTPIPNRFGFTSYLYEHRGLVFLDRTFPLITSTSEREQWGASFYSKNLVAPLPGSLGIYIGNQQLQLLARIRTYDPDSPEFMMLWNFLVPDLQIAIAEHVIVRLATGATLSPQEEKIRNIYRNYIYSSPEPVQDIARELERVKEKGVGRGRKPQPGTKQKTRRLDQEEIPEILQGSLTGKTIYYHSLWSRVVDRTSYNVTARFNKADGRIRVFDPTNRDVTWRDATDYERPVYNALIQREIMGLTSDFEKYPVYGTIHGGDGKFRIRVKATERPRRRNKNGGMDGRFLNRGRVCKTWQNKIGLVEILWDIRVPPPEIFDLPRAQMVRAIGVFYESRGTPMPDDFDEEKIRFFYSWLFARGQGGRKDNRQEMCDAIRANFAATGRLLVT